MVGEEALWELLASRSPLLRDRPVPAEDCLGEWVDRALVSSEEEGEDACRTFLAC